MNYLKHLKSTEPVRLYLYGLMGPILALLMAKGLIDGSDVAVYTAIGTVVLLGPAVELTRKAVVSPATHEAVVEAVAEAVVQAEVEETEPEPETLFELEDPYQGRHFRLTP